MDFKDRIAALFNLKEKGKNFRQQCIENFFDNKKGILANLSIPFFCSYFNSSIMYVCFYLFKTYEDGLE